MSRWSNKNKLEMIYLLVRKAEAAKTRLECVENLRRIQYLCSTSNEWLEIYKRDYQDVLDELHI